jgi:hypothetical protein
MKLSKLKALNQRISEFYTHDRAFTILFFFAILVRCYEITLPYIKIYEGGFQEIIAVNHLKYGFLNTHFVSILGNLHGQNIYHPNHPPLLQILLAISFKIFGIHEWGARLVPILFSLGGIVLIYLTVQKVWDKKTALLASIFMAFMPMSAYFGRIVNFEAVALFFVLLVLYGYVNWIENDKKSYFLIMVIGTILGGLTDWAFYLILPCLFGYSLIIKRKVKLTFLLLCIGISLAILYIAYEFHLSGTSLDCWMGMGMHRHGSGLLTNPQLYTTLLERMIFYFTPFIMLSLCWLWSLFKEKDCQNIYKHYLVLFIFLYGLSYIIILSQSAYVHPWNIYYLLPFIAISIALEIQKAPKKVIFAIIIIFLITSMGSIAYLHSCQYTGYFARGQFINENSNHTDVIFIQSLTSEAFYAKNCTTLYFTKHNANNKTDFISKEKPKFVIYPLQGTVDSHLNQKEFYHFLENKGYGSISNDNIYIFCQLHHPPLVEIFAIAPSIPLPINANFSNKIGFLGYDMDKTKLEIGDMLHITYYWKCLECMEKDYSVFVHFTDSKGNIIFQQDHPFCYGEYPTSEWNTREIIKEEYYFPVPAKVKEGAYNIKIGVYIPHKERLDVVTTEAGTWDGWRLVIGEIRMDIPWEFKYKTHAWLISTLCIYLAFLGFYRKGFGFDV